MGKDRKFRSLKRKKISFCGNRYTTKNTTGTAEESSNNINLDVQSTPDSQQEATTLTLVEPVQKSNVKLSISHSKVTPILSSPTKSSSINHGIPVPDANSAEKPLKGNRIIDMENLSQAISVLSCPECSDTVQIVEKSKQGLSLEFEICCQMCDWSHTFWSSKKRVNRRGFDINSRMYYAMRSIGRGYKDLIILLYPIDHPPPMCEKNYRRISTNFNTVIKNEAKKIMTTTCEEVRSIKIQLSVNKNESLPASMNITPQGSSSTHSDKSSSSSVIDIGVSVDGTWQRRGYCSLHRYCQGIRY